AFVLGNESSGCCCHSSSPVLLILLFILNSPNCQADLFHCDTAGGKSDMNVQSGAISILIDQYAAPIQQARLFAPVQIGGLYIAGGNVHGDFCWPRFRGVQKDFPKGLGYAEFFLVEVGIISGEIHVGVTNKRDSRRSAFHNRMIADRMVRSTGWKYDGHHECCYAKKPNKSDPGQCTAPNPGDDHRDGNHRGPGNQSGNKRSICTRGRRSSVAPSGFYPYRGYTRDNEGQCYGDERLGTPRFCPLCHETCSRLLLLSVRNISSV